jgi:hypothetical protein
MLTTAHPAASRNLIDWKSGFAEKSTDYFESSIQEKLGRSLPRYMLEMTQERSLAHSSRLRSLRY